MYILKEIRGNKLGSIIFIISLFISSMCISIALNMILNEVNYTREYNKFADNNNIVDLIFNEKEEFEKVITIGESIAKDKYEVTLPKARFSIDDKVGYAVGIINKFKKFNVINGRNFTKEELNGLEKKIIIGNNYIDKSYMRNNKQFIDIFNETFEVIGVIGEKYGGQSFYDFNVYIPYKALPKQILEFKVDIVQMTVSNKNFKIDEDFKMKNNILNYDIKNINRISINERVKNKYTNFFNYIVILFIFVLCNTLLLTMSWINNRKYKISIKIVLGYSMKKIIKDLIVELGVLTLIANSLSAICYNALSTYISSLFYIRVGLSPMNFIFGLLISLIICIIVSLIEFFIISKSNINSIMQS